MENNYKLPVVVTRCSNLYGEGDANFSRLFPNTIRKLVNGESPVIWKGVENGTREFLYIKDAVTKTFTLCGRCLGRKDDPPKVSEEETAKKAAEEKATEEKATEEKAVEESAAQERAADSQHLRGGGTCGQPNQQCR